MKKSNLKELIIRAKTKDKKSILTLIEQFDPLIKKYEYQLNYDDAKSDLIEQFIRILYNIPDIDNEYCILSYISKSMYFAFIHLSKRNQKINKNELQVEDEFLAEINYTNFNCEQIDYNDALNQLKPQQRQVIEFIYFKEYSMKQICALLHVSRQTVYSYKKKALTAMKIYLEKGEM